MLAILQQGTSGHRKDWYHFFRTISKNQVKLVYASDFINLLRIREKLLITFFDEKKYFFLFLIVSRSLLFRKTVSIYFSWPNKKKGKVLSLKFIEYYFFLAFSYFLNIKLISPFFRKSNIFLTDLNFFDIHNANEYISQIPEYDFAFFGGCSKEKNIGGFLEVASKLDSSCRILIQTGSNLSKQFRESIKEMKGLTLINEYLPKKSLLKLMSKSEYIWAYYDESYNQSSGIVGHAIQLNRKVFVRKGSLLGRLEFSNILPIENIDDIPTFINKDRTPHSDIGPLINSNNIYEATDRWRSVLLG